MPELRLATYFIHRELIGASNPWLLLSQTLDELRLTPEKVTVAPDYEWGGDNQFPEEPIHLRGYHCKFVVTIEQAHRITAMRGLALDHFNQAWRCEPAECSRQQWSEFRRNPPCSTMSAQHDVFGIQPALALTESHDRRQLGIVQADVSGPPLGSVYRQFGDLIGRTSVVPGEVFLIPTLEGNICLDENHDEEGGYWEWPDYEFAFQVSTVELFTLEQHRWPKGNFKSVKLEGAAADWFDCSTRRPRKQPSSRD